MYYLVPPFLKIHIQGKLSLSAPSGKCVNKSTKAPCPRNEEIEAQDSWKTLMLQIGTETVVGRKHWELDSLGGRDELCSNSLGEPDFNDC